jgi:transglutaminase-like putative cysteine protease
VTAFLQSGDFIDSGDANVRSFAERTVAGVDGDVPRAVALYRAVRDGIVYDPYQRVGSPSAFRASTVLADERGFCIGKAALLAAAARAVGIPARVGYADVKNHLATPRLLEQLGTDLFVWHGYAQLQLDGAWVKATPAFDTRLCEKFGVAPLEFDGRTDSLFQPFNGRGDQYMEYVRDRGLFADVPANEILAAFVATYPGLLRAARVA